jgi:hypothetical protein
MPAENRGEKKTSGTHAVSSNVDSFENHDVSRQLESQSIEGVDVAVHKGVGSC